MSVPASPLVSADWLAAQLDDPALRIADLRWYLAPATEFRAELARIDPEEGRDAALAAARAAAGLPDEAFKVLAPGASLTV